MMIGQQETARPKPNGLGLAEGLRKQQIGCRVRLPGRGVMLADPGFLIAELIKPSQDLQVPIVALLQSALRRMRGHREISDFHGAFLSLLYCGASLRCAHRHARRNTTNRVGNAARGLRSLALRRTATIVRCVAGGMMTRILCRGAATSRPGRRGPPPISHQRAPNVVRPNSSFCVDGCERQYCGGAATCPPSSAAACQPQRGS